MYYTSGAWDLTGVQWDSDSTMVVLLVTNKKFLAGCRVQLSAIASDFQMNTSPSRKIKISKQPTNQVDRNFFSRNGLKATISIFEKKC